MSLSRSFQDTFSISESQNEIVMKKTHWEKPFILSTNITQISLKFTVFFLHLEINIYCKKLRECQSYHFVFVSVFTNYQQTIWFWTVDNLSAIINGYWHWQSSHWSLAFKIVQDSELIGKQLLLSSSAHYGSIL